MAAFAGCKETSCLRVSLHETAPLVPKPLWEVPTLSCCGFRKCHGVRVWAPKLSQGNDPGPQKSLWKGVHGVVGSFFLLSSTAQPLT